MAEAFLALVIYPSSADAQTRQADNLANMASEEILRQPGLLRARVLLSEDGTTIMTLTEWRDRASFQKFRRATSAARRRRSWRSSTPSRTGSASTCRSSPDGSQ
jgi:heme-degrading monooxygenase HmoA